MSLESEQGIINRDQGTGIRDLNSGEQGSGNREQENTGPGVTDPRSPVPDPGISGSRSPVPDPGISGSRSPIPDPGVSEIAIKVENLTKIYKLYDSPQDRLKESLHPLRKKYHHEFFALHDLSFEIKKGETIGIIGQNGAGKSTLLKIITGVLTPSSGMVTVNGKISALLELGAGFNPELTGIENVYFNGTLMGYTREEMDARLEHIVSFAEIGEFVYQPVKTYSSGMYIRLAFAVAVNVEPEILIVDEALAVGDMMFQAKCMDKIKSMMKKGITTLFVTHDVNTVNTLCSNAMMLEGGRIFTMGKPQVVTLQYYQVMREKEHAVQALSLDPTAVDKEDVASRYQHVEDEIRSKSSEENYNYGTGAAKIIDFEILDAQRQKTIVLKCGEPFSVGLAVEFFEKVEHPCVGFSLSNVAGQNLLAVHSFHDGPYDFGPQEPGDILEVEMETTMLLNPGKFLLSFGVAEHRTTADFTNFDARRNACTVEVYGKETSFGMIYHTPRIRMVPRQGAQLAKSTALCESKLSLVLKALEGKEASSFGTCPCGHELDIRDFLFREHCSRCGQPFVKKIDIGAGSRIAPDYVHLDTRPLDHIEIVTAAHLLPIPDGMIDEVYSRHTIEHFSDEDLPHVLGEWARVLKNGGRLVVNYPDFDKYLAWFAAKQDLPIEEKSRLIYGDQNYPENTHRCAVTQTRVKALLGSIGLTGITSTDAPVFLDYETPLIGTETVAIKPPRKLTVLLVCDLREWALGTVAHYFARYNGDLYDLEIMATGDDDFNACLNSAVGRYDLIHWLSPWLFIEYGNLVSLPQVVSINHIVDASQFIEQCRSADAIHTLSREWEGKIRELGFEDVFRISIGVDENVFYPHSHRNATLHDDAHKKRILLPLFGKESSNQDDRKGTEFLLQIIRALAENYEVSLIITGYGWEGFTEQLDALNVPYRRVTLQESEEISNIYAEFDFFVITSKIEGGPFPLLEAMASGIPVISTPVGIAKEVIIDGINGFIIQYGDVNSAVDRIKLLINDRQFLTNMGAKARETIVREWTWEKVSLRRLAPLYAKALENHRVKSFIRNHS